jgi:hypothetical protein
VFGKNIMSSGIFKKSKNGVFFTNLSLLENLQICLLLPQNCTRGTGTHHQEPWQAHTVSGAGDKHYRNNSMNDGVRGLEIHILCFEKRSIHVEGK